MGNLHVGRYHTHTHALTHTYTLTLLFVVTLCFCVFCLSVIGLKQDRSVYCEDWGEALTNKSVPVICVVNLQSGSISVLQGAPPDVSPGQVRTDGLSGAPCDTAGLKFF